MKLKAFCAWGDGPDVGINIELTPEEQKLWDKGLIPIDLTADGALDLAAQLIDYAWQAKELEKLCNERDGELAGALARETDG